ncbi:mechanosensitive ion channel family protein [Hydromonas duriensis]|uniref:Mechanosensitive ion channel-like protein n=1 Tax=Hydromonas duriensis TaxID=1527608 RepID=A0A4V3DK15_9BURK|nr:mechanosensitive ion channel domain-containing protein [Hydromonas duriensis]TDR32356.1 mechanosensitive ion channel-like protein [Hydromonas duriensis]
MFSTTTLNPFVEGAEFNGFFDLFSHITVQDWAITAGFIALALALTWALRVMLKRRISKRDMPSWVSVDVITRLMLPFFLWLLADTVRYFYNKNGLSEQWFEFLAQIFGAFLLVRVFLYVVRRALPVDGSVRHAIEKIAIVSIWAVMLLDYVGQLDVWVERLDALQVTFGKNTITAKDVLTLCLVLVVVWLVVQWLIHEIELMLLKRPNRYFAKFDLSARVVIVRILNALLLVAGVLFALNAAGINLTILSVFGGALGVGIGLGLQKIASNYVSGFVILFERSVRIGDLITTNDGFRGNVSQINARYTVLKGASGDEVLLPNETLVTTPIVNWSLQDKELWMSIPIQLKHTVDIDFILPKLLEALIAVPRVLKDPAPSVLLSKITDKGFVLDITWWIGDPENGRMNITSDVNLAIWRTCREHQVEFFTLQIPEVDKLPVPKKG